MPLFGRGKYTVVKLKKKEIPEGLWTKCEGCGQPIYKKTLEENFRVCPKCNYHFTLTAKERIKLLIDVDTFQELDKEMSPCDPLSFQGPKSYKEKLRQDEETTGLHEAVITGTGNLDSKKIAIA